MLLYATASIRSGLAQWFFDWQGMLSFAATVALVIVTAVYVVLTRGLRNASETATGLARQALDHDRNSVALEREALDHDRERWQADLAERERGQAQCVACTFEGPRVLDGGNPSVLTWRVSNTSSTPIYQLRSFVAFQGVLHRDDAPAGSILESARETPITQNGKFSVENVPLDHIGITFRDNAGRFWVKWASGHLRRLGPDPGRELLVSGAAYDPPANL